MRAALVLLAVLAGSTWAGAATAPESAGWHSRGQALRGDVDGDGTRDTAVLQYRPHTCDFRLVVNKLTAPVRPKICKDKPAELYAGPDPHVAVLADLDDRPGLEVIVQLGRGAYMEFADIWTVRDGALRRFAGREPQLSYGASVGTGGDVVDCARQPGVVLISSQSYRAPAGLFRGWYSARGLRLELIRARSIPWSAKRAVPFHEFREPQPFPTCAKARAQRR